MLAFLAVFGGYAGQALNDLYNYEFETGRWAKLPTQGKTPPARHSATLVFVPRYDQLVLFGGVGEYGRSPVFRGWI